MFKNKLAFQFNSLASIIGVNNVFTQTQIVLLIILFGHGVKNHFPSSQTLAIKKIS